MLKDDLFYRRRENFNEFKKSEKFHKIYYKNQSYFECFVTMGNTENKHRINDKEIRNDKSRQYNI